MRREIPTEESKELTPEDLEEDLTVKISKGTNWEMIKRNVEDQIFLRFAVTNDSKIVLAPGSHTHDGLLGDNGLDWGDCAITNGVLREEDNQSLTFIYHSTTRSPLHFAVQKKLIKYLEERSGMNLSSRKISSVYSTD